MSERCIEHPPVLKLVRPGDRFGGMTFHFSKEESFCPGAKRSIFVKRSFGNERCHAARNGMLLPCEAGRNGRLELVPIMALIIAAENLRIELFPILKGMACRAETNQRPAGMDVILDLIELILRERHPPNEKNSEIRPIQCFKAGNALNFLVIGSLENDRFHGEILLQIPRECREGFLAVVFIFAGDKYDRGPVCGHHLREKGAEKQRNGLHE